MDERADLTSKRVSDLEDELRRVRAQLSAALERVSNEQRFRTLAENDTDGISRFDRSLRRIYANPGIATILGLPLDTMVGKSNRELDLPEELTGAWDTCLRKVFETAQPRSMETWLSTPTGRRYIESRLVPEVGLNGDVESVLGITRDLTDRKLAEDALQKSGERFRQLVELVPDILYRAELPDFHASFISPAVERILGFTPKEWESDPQLWLRQLHEDDRARVLLEVKSALTHADHFVVRYRLWHKDGRILRWFEDRGRVERAHNGRPAMIFGVLTDITEHVRADEAIRQREQEFRALAERSPDVVARIDRDLRYRYINPAIEGTSGRAPEYFLNKTIFELDIPADIASLWVEHLRAVLATGEDRRFMFRYIGPRGKTRSFDARLVPEFGSQGEVTGVISVTREITRQRQAEEQIQRTVKQLETLNQLLQEQSRTDALTGLANRRHLFDYMDKEWRRETRHGRPISLIMADIDFFKAYNDYYGHLSGDECLRRVADALRSQVRRPGDLLARYGGEEFVVVLPETPLAGARELAEAMRTAVANMHIAHDASRTAPYVTVSLGVSELSPKEHKTDDIFMLADAALYRAKESGRNRVESLA